PLLGDESGHRRAQERLAGVRDATLAEGGSVLATPAPEIPLVVDEERCAVLGGELLEQARVAERRRNQLGFDRRRHCCCSVSSSRRAISSGAETPSRPSASASPIRHASDSHRRACVSASSSLMTRQSR